MRALSDAQLRTISFLFAFDTPATSMVAMGVFGDMTSDQRRYRAFKMLKSLERRAIVDSVFDGRWKLTAAGRVFAQAIRMVS